MLTVITGRRVTFMEQREQLEVYLGVQPPDGDGLSQVAAEEVGQSD